VKNKVARFLSTVYKYKIHNNTVERAKLSINIFRNHSSNKITFDNSIVLDAKRRIMA